MRVPGIYAIFQESQERWVYAGSSVDIRSRTRSHRNSLNRNAHINPHLQNVWNKYGAGDFWFVGVEKCPDEILIEREQYWLDTLKPICNIAICSDNPMRGRKHSPETRAKIAARLAVAMLGNRHSTGCKLSEETRARMSAARIGNTNTLGYKPTAETRAKLSAARKGKPKSAETRARMSEAWKLRKAAVTE